MSEARGAAPQGRPTTYNLLFVCTGNTCRSPMATAIARREIEARGWGKLVDVRSAGVAAAAGEPASSHAVEVAREHGVDLMEHAASPLTPELVAWADLILAMSFSHAAAAVELGADGKVALVTDFGSEDGASEPIEDPYGSDVEAYRRTWDQLEEAIRATLDRLEPILAP